MSMYYPSEFGYARPSTITDAIWHQSINLSPENFLCKTCKCYLGNCACQLGIFIAFEGANLLNCYGYRKGTKCIHCGKIT